MKILVSGGAGFIGIVFVSYLFSSNQYSVINLDKLTYAGNLESIPESLQNERYSFEQLDICSGELF